MNKRDLAKSIHQRLSNIAQERKVAFPSIATEFLIERLLARLVEHAKLIDHLVFKGGFVAMKIYESPRYTIDLDALAQGIAAKNLSEHITSASNADLNDAVWFHFQETIDLETQGEYGGIRFTFRAGIGEPLKDLKRAQIINLDIGFGDPITPGPIKAKMKSILKSGELSWSVYPIETMIAEKLHALISRRDFNSRSKDILDLSLFFPKANSKILKRAIEKTFKFRATEIPDDILASVREINLTILEKGWAKATMNIPEAPRFHDSFKMLLNEIKDKLS